MSGVRSAATLRAKAAYVATMRRLGRGLSRAGALPALAPSRDHRARHWAYSLTRVYDVDALVGLDVPWWTYRAIDAVERWLAGRTRPVRVFEYGSGASTLWLSKRVDEVVTVEHDRAFADYLQTLLAATPNVDLRVVEAVPSERPAVSSGKEGQSGRDFASYVEAIAHTDDPFDLIVIDGRARAACLRAALPRLAADGLVVFDNSRRARYRSAITSSGLTEIRLKGLTPTLPYPEQTSLLTATPSSVPTSRRR